MVKLRHQRLAAPQRLYALKKRRVCDAAILNDLAQARADLTRIERFQRIAVNQYPFRLIKRAEQVLSSRMVDCHLAANGGIHLCQQRRRHLNQMNAAQIGARRIARQVADHAAAQRNHIVLPGQMRIQKRVIQLLKLRHALGRFARGQDKQADLRPRQLKLTPKHVGIQRRDVFIRHNHRSPACAHGKQRRSMAEQPVPDMDFIAFRLFRRSHVHNRHILHLT